MTSREFVGVVVFLVAALILGLSVARWQAPSPPPLPPLAQGPDKACLTTEPYAFVKAAAFCRKHYGTSECWAEIVHAGTVCRKALGCPYAKTDEEARSPVVSECEAPCVEVMHALDAHYGVSR